MNNPFSKEDVLRAVGPALSGVRRISAAEIGHSCIVDDLGAQSLDCIEFSVHEKEPGQPQGVAR